MRMSFAGAGYPLTLLMFVAPVSLVGCELTIDFRAEDSTGPTTTCEITTFDPEPSLELPFDSETT